MTLEQDLVDLHALNARFIHNCITRDVASHDAITHPQFVCLSSNGKYTEKSAYLAYWASLFRDWRKQAQSLRTGSVFQRSWF